MELLSVVFAFQRVGIKDPKFETLSGDVWHEALGLILSIT